MQMLTYLGLWLLSVTEIVWWLGREGLLFGWREATPKKSSEFLPNIPIMGN